MASIKLYIILILFFCSVNTRLLVVWVLWHINLCKVIHFDANSSISNNSDEICRLKFTLKGAQYENCLQNLAWEHSLIVKNISISSYSIYSNSSISNNSV